VRPGRARRLLPSSLTGRLIATVVAVVLATTVLITVVTTVVMSHSLDQQLNTDVAAALNRSMDRQMSLGLQRPDDDDLPVAPRERRRPGFGAGDREGTLDARYGGTAAEYAQLLRPGNGRKTLSTADSKILRQVAADGRSHEVDLPDAGSFRVRAATVGDVTVVAGQTTRSSDALLAKLVLAEVLLGLGALVVASGAGLVLVRRQLRPLREVADTAHQVSELPLSSGEIGTTVRVPDQLTDERSEVGQVGAALNTMLAHVEHALDERHRSEQQVRQFVADASHELRTPLSTIHGYAELSRRTQPSDPAQLALAMTKVEAEATRMSSLVEDLLLLARLDAGRPLARDEVDLTRLVLETVADARVVGPEHRWRFDLPDEPVEAPGDEQRLHQVVTNLLNNARRHTPPGTTVTVGVHRDADEAVLTVLDDGPGMSPELVDKAFERFTRGDSSRTRESGGAGLGLSLVEAITSAHGGTVSVASEPGRTCFEVRLPAPTDAPAERRVEGRVEGRVDGKVEGRAAVHR
jgi:two-component system OmpR family sensor kinase